MPSYNKVNFAFGITNLSGVNGYKIYAKQGPFSNLNVPSGQFLIRTLQSNQTYGSYTVPTSGEWHFRVYSYNTVGNIMSTGFASGVINVVKRNSIEDLSISSLGFEGFLGSNLAGIVSTGYYYGDSPVFQWQVGLIDKNSILPSGSKYRITTRQTSSGNIPSSTIYYETTGNLISPGDPGRFVYPFEANLKSNNNSGPYREFDIVVEAVDPSGNTSAGNTVSPRREIWSNPKGYDIFYVNNQAITGIYLSSGHSHRGSYRTEQYIDIDGEINVKFTSGMLPPDLIGVYIYSSTGLFSGQNINPGVKSQYVIHTGEALHDGSLRFISTNSNLKNNGSGYIAMSFYDSFDNVYKKYTNIKTGLWVSNVVSVISSGHFGFLTVNNLIINTPSGYVSSLVALAGSGSPEGIVYGNIGQPYLDTGFGNVYWKRSGVNTNVGWM